MKQLSKKEKLLGRIFILIIFSIIFGMIFLLSRCENNYIKKNGVWTILTVNKDNTVGNPNTYTYDYTFKGKNHKGAARTSIGDTLTRKSRRIFMMVVPDKPNKHLIFSDAVPYWFTAEAPYDGWKTFPTDEDLWAEMKAQGVEPGQPRDWSYHPDKKKTRRTRIVYGIFLTIFGAIFFSIDYYLKKENKKNKSKKQEEITKE